MKNQSFRRILYAKDIMKLTKRTYRSALRMAALIRKQQGVNYVSTDAFCAFTGIKEETMRNYLNEND
jgi:mevalonate pyrophosphate decarboxylase